ncbi:MAG: hypothetical protein ACP5D2_00495 [Candidatus Nanoarchaeia archaeon]
MKKYFRKALTIAGSALMLGSTIGMAAAASYASPFISGSTADVAVVYGADTPNNADKIAALNVQSNLAGKLAGETGSSSSGSTVSGESYKIELASTRFHLGDSVKDIVSGTVTDDDLPTLLADGVYRDDSNNDNDYTQKLELGNWTLEMFNDRDYSKDDPTIGIWIADRKPVLNYTLDFTDEPDFGDLETTDMKIMGRNYYVLDVSSDNTTITLLDAADSIVLNEGETRTLEVNDDSYEVSISFIGQNSVKLNVNGETTSSLSEDDTYKLSDGAYVGIKDISTQDYQGGIKQVEFSIGSGKLVLDNTNEVEMNDDPVYELYAYIENNSNALSSIVLEWKADGDLFIAPDSEPVMPGFGTIKLTWGGMTYPKQEVISVIAGGDEYIKLSDFPLKDGAVDINLIYGNGTHYIGTGVDATEVLRTVGPGENLTFDGNTDSYFVASFNDGTNAESYLMRARNFKRDGSVNRTTIEYMKDGTWTTAKSDAKAGDTVTRGNVVLTLGAINYADKTAVIQSGTNVEFNELFTDEGMLMYLPWVNDTYYVDEISGSGGMDVTCSNMSFDAAGNLNTAQLGFSNINVINEQHNSSAICTYYPDEYNLTFWEESKTGTIAGGNSINLTLGWYATDSQVSVKEIYGGGDGFEEQGSSDLFESHVYSALATKILWDKSGNQQEAELTYHGEESYGNVFVAEESAEITSDGGTTTPSTELGTVIVADDELTSAEKAKNLIVVGGSCINSVAAELLGGSYCESDFTDKTDIAAGEFLIQSFENPYNSDKVAMLVAGYHAADTEDAVTYLTNNAVTTDVGTKLKGTSATSAEVISA